MNFKWFRSSKAQNFGNTSNNNEKTIVCEPNLRNTKGRNYVTYNQCPIRHYRRRKVNYIKTTCIQLCTNTVISIPSSVYPPNIQNLHNTLNLLSTKYRRKINVAGKNEVTKERLPLVHVGRS